MSDSLLKSTIAGSWYPADKNALETMLKRFLSAAGEPPHGEPCALLAPHAGYEWSGPAAAWAYKTVQGRSFERVILLAPSHRYALEDRAVLPESDGTETPLGVLPFDRAGRETLLGNPLFAVSDTVHRAEHSTQIQYPFLQTVLSGAFRVLPVIVGSLSPEAAEGVAEVLRPLLTERTLLVISSDFIHYGADFNFTPFAGHALENAKKMNMEAWELIRNGDPASLRQFIARTGATICGICPILVLLHLYGGGTVRAELLRYETSADRAGGPEESFVCYLSAVFRRTSPPEEGVLSGSDKKILLAMAREAIGYVFEHRKLPPAGLFASRAPERTKARMGAFVTLKMRGTGDLRGCIGEIEPYRPLYQAVTARACDAAFRDPRFFQLSPEELENVVIEISALTPAHPVSSWREIEIGRHGMTIEKDGRGAVFLPQVAEEQGWDLAETLTHLSRKAGLPPDAWKADSARFTVFEAIVFSEDAPA